MERMQEVGEGRHGDYRRQGRAGVGDRECRTSTGTGSKGWGGQVTGRKVVGRQGVEGRYRHGAVKDGGHAVGGTHRHRGPGD